MIRILTLLFVSLAAAQQSPFAAVPPVADGTLRFTGQMPPFEAKDIAGKTWRSQDLRGRFTLVYIWSTQEGRMQDRVDAADVRGIFHFLDLSELQRFYDKVKDNPHLQVVTFCRDYESGDSAHARDYMRQHGYTFPVITDYISVAHVRLGIEDQFPSDWSSGAWLVNPAGQLSYRVRGWTFGRLLFEAERAAGN